MGSSKELGVGLMGRPFYDLPTLQRVSLPGVHDIISINHIYLTRGLLLFPQRRWHQMMLEDCIPPCVKVNINMRDTLPSALWRYVHSIADIYERARRYPV